MALVDPDDDTIGRWLVTCHMIDPEVGYRRHVPLAAFDTARAMEAWFHDEQARRADLVTAGEGDAREWLSGRFLPAGVRQPTPQPRRRRRR